MVVLSNCAESLTVLIYQMKLFIYSPPCSDHLANVESYSDLVLAKPGVVTGDLASCHVQRSYHLVSANIIAMRLKSTDLQKFPKEQRDTESCTSGSHGAVVRSVM
jgi:hypothetical protein